MTFTPPDVIHFSALKQLARSPAHFRLYCEQPHETTREMRIGSVAHHQVLGSLPGGKSLHVFEGDARRGKAWDAFEAEHSGELIVTAPEHEEGNAIAAAVGRHDGARRHLEGARYEVPLSWEMHGFKCATAGVDWIGPPRDIGIAQPPRSWGDLKTCRCSEPEAFARDATRMLYYAQLAFYREGLEAHEAGPVPEPRIIAVESSPPHNVTVMRVPERVLDQGRKSIALWFTILKSCIDSGDWPGYVQDEVEFELPKWMGDGDDDA